jgi:NAD(P)H-dependent flavin oxidoreductase YrpB (nitropropane dioxygenase family)
VAMGTRFLLTQESRVPDAVKRVYLDTQVTGTVVTTAVDGVPQRVIRTPLIDRLERAGFLGRLWRALGHAWAFRKLTGSSFFALLREGWAMKERQGLTLAQLAMAAGAPMLTRAALVEGRPEVGILPTGQNVGLIGELPTVAELVREIVDEADAVLDGFAARRRPEQRRSAQ